MPQVAKRIFFWPPHSVRHKRLPEVFVGCDHARNRELRFGPAAVFGPDVRHRRGSRMKLTTFSHKGLRIAVAYRLRVGRGPSSSPTPSTSVATTGKPAGHRLQHHVGHSLPGRGQHQQSRWRPGFRAHRCASRRSGRGRQCPAAGTAASKPPAAGLRRPGAGRSRAVRPATSGPSRSARHALFAAPTGRRTSPDDARRTAVPGRQPTCRRPVRPSMRPG